MHHTELGTWEDWSWQLRRYVRLYKPFAKRMMDDVEGSQRVNADDLSEAFDVQQTGAQNSELLAFASRQLACMLAQITDGTAWAILRNKDTERL